MTAPLQGAAAAMRSKALLELEHVLRSTTVDRYKPLYQSLAEDVLDMILSTSSVTGDLLRVQSLVAASDVIIKTTGPQAAGMTSETVQQWLLMNADQLVARNLTPDDL